MDFYQVGRRLRRAMDDRLGCENCLNSEVRDDGTLWCVPGRRAADPDRDECDGFDPILDVWPAVSGDEDELPDC